MNETDTQREMRILLAEIGGFLGECIKHHEPMSLKASKEYKQRIDDVFAVALEQTPDSKIV